MKNELLGESPQMSATIHNLGIHQGHHLPWGTPCQQQANKVPYSTHSTGDTTIPGALDGLRFR